MFPCVYNSIFNIPPPSPIHRNDFRSFKKLGLKFRVLDGDTQKLVSCLKYSIPTQLPTKCPHILENKCFSKEKKDTYWYPKLYYILKIIDILKNVRVCIYIISWGKKMFKECKLTWASSAWEEYWRRIRQVHEDS